MITFLKSIFGGKNGHRSDTEPAVEYKGFTIQPTPGKTNGGWTTAANISKTIEGETKTHLFIRADTTASQDVALELIISKAKIFIDQVGDKIFSD